MGTGGSFPRVKREADHLPHLVPRLSMSRSYTSSSRSVCTASSGTALLFIIPGRQWLSELLQTRSKTALTQLVTCAWLDPRDLEYYPIPRRLHWGGFPYVVWTTETSISLLEKPHDNRYSGVYTSFLNTAPRSHVVDRRFRDAYCLRHQGIQLNVVVE
jgi:hypothetical protein